jgi:UDP-glucose 4-epimerase
MINKTILVTGAHGFLGRYTAKRYKEAHYHVIGIGHGKWYENEYSKWGIDEWYETTITFEALININKRFDIIVHCGGGASVGFSYQNPYEDFQKSVQSTLSLLEYIRLQCVECKFIYASSPAVQGNLGKILIQESMTSTPISPYGFHKRIAEDLCQSYNKTYGVKVGIIRFFSIYGEGLKKQLLWDACNKINQSNEALFFGTGAETRDWLHVSDAAALIEKFSISIVNYEVINGGSGKEIMIKDIVYKLRDGFELKTKITFNGFVKEGDPVHFCADITKALSLGWAPIVDLDTGLKKYIQYYKQLDK